MGYSGFPTNTIRINGAEHLPSCLSGVIMIWARPVLTGCVSWHEKETHSLKRHRNESSCLIYAKRNYLAPSQEAREEKLGVSRAFLFIQRKCIGLINLCWNYHFAGVGNMIGTTAETQQKDENDHNYEIQKSFHVEKVIKGLRYL